MGYAGSGALPGAAYNTTSNTALEMVPYWEGPQDNVGRTRCLNVQGLPNVRLTIERLAGDAANQLDVTLRRRVGTRNSDALDFLRVGPVQTVAGGTAIANLTWTGINAADVAVFIQDGTGGVGNNVLRLQIEATA